MNIDIFKVGYLETNCYILTKNNKSIRIKKEELKSFVADKTLLKDLKEERKAALARLKLNLNLKIEKDEYEAAYWAEKALVDIHDEAINLINHLTMSSEEIS